MKLWVVTFLVCRLITSYRPDNVPAGCYRLPTEAEWEYSARAGTNTRVSISGDDINYSDALDHAWHGPNSMLLGSSHPDYGTQPVGQKLPNPWNHMIYGVMCMSGVMIGMSLLPDASATDPYGPSSGTNKILRSGGWHNPSSHMRSAMRWEMFPPTNHNFDFGFTSCKDPISRRNAKCCSISYTNQCNESMPVILVSTLSWDAVPGATRYCTQIQTSNIVDQTI